MINIYLLKYDFIYNQCFSFKRVCCFIKIFMEKKYFLKLGVLNSKESNISFIMGEY